METLAYLKHIFFSGEALAAFLTLCIFSFLYKDNPFYKIAENLVVGTSLGYSVMITLWVAFKPKFWDPLTKEGKFWVIIPAILGLLILFQISKKYMWISRYPMAILLGTGSGFAIPLVFQASVLRQLEATILKVGFTNKELINNFLIVIMCVAGLLYFFFSVHHKGVVGKVATFGIWVIMVGFGASFGYTVMARISLLIGRIQFLLSDWLMVIK